LTSIINHASELLSPGESAIVVFTRKMHLVRRNADGSGTSGNWHMNPDYHDIPDKLVIYNRPSADVPHRNEVYLATYLHAVESGSPGRMIIHFQDIRQAGTTSKSWYDFAETGQGPVRYLSK
jgi:hypothetical protein